MSKKKKKMSEKQSLASTGKQYVNADFTEDGFRMHSDALVALADAYEKSLHAETQGERVRALRLYTSLFGELQKLGLTDFTEDATDATYRKLISLFTQLNRILGSQQFFRMLDKLTDAERNTLYNHPIHRDVDGLLP